MFGRYKLLIHYWCLYLIQINIKIGLLTPSFLPSCETQQEYWAARASASSSCRRSWLCAPFDRVYGKTDQTNPVQRRERGMEDERKSGRMRGWNGCTHKEGEALGEGRRGGGDAVVVVMIRVSVFCSFKEASLSHKSSVQVLWWNIYLPYFWSSQTFLKLVKMIACEVVRQLFSPQKVMHQLSAFFT